MPTPCNNYIVPVFQEDECLGERVKAQCVVDSSTYSELSIPTVPATQQQINQAIYNAYISLKAATDELAATAIFPDGTETKIIAEVGSEITVTGTGAGSDPYTIGLDFDASVYQLRNIPNDTNVASAANEGRLRYRTDANNSYVDMCMKVGVGLYAWQNIVSNNF